MTPFFPDLNVWLALSVSGHPHSARAWRWLERAPSETRLYFSRYTQLGLLRLLTNPAVMGEQTLTVRKAWSVYDQWDDDPRVEFHADSRGLDAEFRDATRPFANQLASKAIGDCYLLAFAKSARSVLVTFDVGLHGHAQRQGAKSVIPE
jgi:hypothetical protein